MTLTLWHRGIGGGSRGLDTLGEWDCQGPWACGQGSSSWRTRRTTGRTPCWKRSWTPPHLPPSWEGEGMRKRVHWECYRYSTLHLVHFSLNKELFCTVVFISSFKWDPFSFIITKGCIIIQISKAIWLQSNQMSLNDPFALSSILFNAAIFDWLNAIKVDGVGCTELSYWHVALCRSTTISFLLECLSLLLAPWLMTMPSLDKSDFNYPESIMLGRGN